jgi:hypothetical protein
MFFREEKISREPSPSLGAKATVKKNFLSIAEVCDPEDGVLQ